MIDLQIIHRHAAVRSAFNRCNTHEPSVKKNTARIQPKHHIIQYTSARTANERSTFSIYKTDLSALVQRFRRRYRGRLFGVGPQLH